MTPLLGPKMTKENYEELKHRVEIFLDDLKYDHEMGETIVIVSHLRPIEMMTYILTGTKRRLENGQTIEVEYKPKKEFEK
jgi:broad specificity phosphatase PhoE